MCSAAMRAEVFARLVAVGEKLCLKALAPYAGVVPSGVPAFRRTKYSGRLLPAAEPYAGVPYWHCRFGNA
jgi:hypothetical protein